MCWPHYNSPDLSILDMVDLIMFHNGLQKWTAIAPPMKEDPLCN